MSPDSGASTPRGCAPSRAGSAAGPRPAASWPRPRPPAPGPTARRAACSSHDGRARGQPAVGVVVVDLAQDRLGAVADLPRRIARLKRAQVADPPPVIALAGQRIELPRQLAPGDLLAQ